MERTFSLLYRKYLHKVNNEIGFILVTLQTIYDERGELLKRDRFLSDSLKMINDAAKKVLALKEEFKVSFEKPESAKEILVQKLLSSSVETTKIPKAINVSINIDENIPPVRATSSLVEVFNNIIRNAVHAMPQGGKLLIEARANEDKKRIEIRFTDTGIGIPDDISTNLFRIGVSTKDGKEHGFGLYWCKSYLNYIGGDIALLCSEINKGTSFLISLPFSKRAVSETMTQLND